MPGSAVLMCSLFLRMVTASELHTLTPALDGPSSTVNVRDRLLWRFIARRLGSLLVLENIDCRGVSLESGVGSSE